MDLTPLQLHYFKRELISSELHNETEQLKKTTADLSSLVKPAQDINSKYPFLQYLSQNFILEFPLLKKGDERGFFDKLQVFLDEYSKIKFNTYTPRGVKDSQRRVLLYKIQKLLIISLTASIKTVQGKEESIKVSVEDSLAQQLDDTHLDTGLQLNIVTVRDFYEKRTIREHLHTEFIIETNLSGTTYHVARRHGQFRQLRDDLKAVFPTLELPSVPSKLHDSNSERQHLHREKDRIILRSYLTQLAALNDVANSDIFRNFIMENPIQLSPEEQKDKAERLKMDESRVNEEKRFRKEVDEKIVELDGLLALLKQQIMKPNGLLEVFDIIKKTEKIDQLPVELQKAIEWGRINFAFVLHTQFITSDKAVENMANLKRTNSLIPYRTIAQILKLSNPFAMVKGILDLFLAQPFGGKSLFQRIMLVNMSEQAKELEKDITELEAKINDPDLCLKIKNAVQTDLPDNVTLGKSSPIQETLDLLKNPTIQPTLTPQQILKVALANQPDKVEARALVGNLYNLWVLYARKQEQEMLMTLVFQGVTGEIIKDLFAIFYEPLAQVYKSANVGDTINHVAAFINELITVVENSSLEDATNTAQSFIDLVQRHEGRFYEFVHNVYARDQTHLFDSLLTYVDGLFSFVANGIPEKIDLYQITTEAGVTAAEYPELKKEIDDLCAYHRNRKQRHLDRKRQKLMNSNEQDQDFSDRLLDDKDVIGVFNDMSEMEYDDFDDTGSIQTSNTSLIAHEMTIRPPELHIIPRIVPVFTEHVKHILKK